MSDRRSFLKRSGAAISAAALTGCGTERDTPGRDDAPGRTPDPILLAALGATVLPGELGEEGTQAAVDAFRAWLDGYEPVAELNHGYGTSEIRYTPPHPGPGWTAQLEALDLEARRRYGQGFVEASLADRKSLVEAQLATDGSELPSPLRARHVAVAVMAHYFGSSAATDRCYGAAIGRQTCRGLSDLGAAPPPLDGGVGP